MGHVRGLEKRTIRDSHPPPPSPFSCPEISTLQAAASLRLSFSSSSSSNFHSLVLANYSSSLIMTLLVYFVLLLALAGRSKGALYCVCKDGVGDQGLQKAIDYACGAGADCTPILQNGPCYQPNTVKDHCNYAVNSYFQKKGQAQGSCDFAGAATTSPTAPTSSSTCVFPSSPGNTGTGTTTTPTSSTPGTSPTTISPTTPTSTTPGTGTGMGTGTGTGTGSGTGTGTGTGTTTGSPNVFGISPTSSTGTGGFNDSSDGVVHSKVTNMLVLSLVLAFWLALRV